MMKTGAELLNDERNRAAERIIKRATLRFVLHGKYFRVRCNETMEEKDFSTLAECLAFADRTRDMMPDEPLGFVITEIKEREAEY